jgi:cell wall-associated NlpC family hydrolase
MSTACSSTKTSSKSKQKTKQTTESTKSRTVAPNKIATSAGSKTVQARPSGTATNVILKRYAAQMNVGVSSLDNHTLYVLVDEWIGVPYKYGGNTKSGVDCSGFVNAIYKKFTSKPLPRTASGLAKVINPVNTNKLREGDLVFFNYDGKRNSHVGIYLQNGFFVHASSMKGVIISDLKSDYYKSRFSKGGSLLIGNLKALTGK